MEKVGLVFGCFIPMHDGHLNLIQRALRENDRVILGICGYDDDRGKDFIPFKVRQEILKKKYGLNKKIILSVVDDKKIGLTGKFDQEAWETWSKEYFTNADIDPNGPYEFTWYTGDKKYVDELSKIFPKHNFFLGARGELSGTMIRNDLKNNLTLIDKSFLKYIFETMRFD